jgi:glycosyltransferase involved in cell wall biosynthesis
MTISVIISTMKRLVELERILKTLQTQTRMPEELVIIDAAADPKVEELVRRESGTISKVHYHAYPSSLTQARNHGIRNSSGDVILFLDDDAMLEPEFIQEILRPLEEDTHKIYAGVTGDLIRYQRGSGLMQLFKRFFMLPCDGDGRFRISGAPTIMHGLPEKQDVEFIPGGLAAWRRTIFSEFSFDESLPGLGVNEDVDFSYRVSRKWKNFYTPAAKADTERPSVAREGTIAYLKMELASSWYLYRKNLPKNPVYFTAFLWHQAGLWVRFAFRRWVRS